MCLLLAAQELIQSWLLRAEDEEHVPSFYLPAAEHGRVANWCALYKSARSLMT